MHDIFAKKQLKEKREEPKAIVEVDFREKNSLVPSELMHQNLAVEFKELKVADYIIKGVAIERKEARDFFGSIFDRRIFSQMSELMQYEKKLLIVEGTLENSPIHKNALKGILLSITLDYKIPILFSRNAEDTAKYIQLIASKEKKEFSINPKKKNMLPDEELQFVLESFPGIGPVKAKKLLENFNSLKRIFSSKTKNLEPVLGKDSEKFSEILEREYSK